LIEKSLDSEALSDAIAATAKPKATKRSHKSQPVLTRPEALAIAQNLYDWAKAALTAQTDGKKLTNSEKLAAVGLVAVFSPENKPAWQAKD